MKWGIVDAYQQPKRSYDFVKRAYQPLLVCLDFTRRRWHNDESFKGAIWIVNDLYKEYKNSNVTIRIKDDVGNVLKEADYKVSKIGENCAFKLTDISYNVLSTVKKMFHVELTLTDKGGKEISTNKYFFLIGDQAEATKQFNEMNKKMSKSLREYTNGNYYRYYPAMIQTDGQNYNSEIEVPVAIGFGNAN